MPDTQHTDTPHTNTWRRLIDLPKQAGVAALYASLVFLDIRYLEGISAFTPFEPGSGLAIAVLLIGGMRYAWGVLIGGILGNMVEAPFLLAALTASADALGALGAAWLLARGGNFDPALRSLRDYLRLISFSAISITVAGSMWGIALLADGFIPSGEYSHELARWWLGDMLGVVLIAPLILVCWLTRDDSINKRQWGEFALLLGLMFLAGQIVFFGWFHESLGHLARGYVMFLFVVWVAMRLGTRGTVIVLNMIGIHALLGAYHGSGYFANNISQPHPTDYWLYVVVLSIVGMALATFLAGIKQAEKALQRSEARYHTLYDSINDAVHLMDETGFIDCNKATLAMCGCATKEEFCSKSPADFSPSEQPCGTSSQILIDRYIATAVEKGNHRFDWVCRRFDNGRLFNIDVQLTVMELDGKPVFLVVARDITERKQSEELLMQSKERLRAYLDNISDTIWVIDINLSMAYVSSSVTRLLGFLPGELTGRQSATIVHPDDMGIIDDAMRHVMEHPGEPKTIQYRVKHKDNRWIPVESTGINLLDNPAINGVLVVMRDISERKQAEAILMESESRFREIFNAVSDAIFIHDAETGRIIDVNRRMCEMYGLTHEEALACDVADLSAGAPPYSTAEAIEKIRLARTVGMQTFDWLARASDGHLFWVEVSLRFAQIGKQQRILAMVRDITERKTAEQQLHDLAKHILDVREDEKTRIAREIHDELGGTLTALKIDTHWLLRKLPAHDETMALIGRIESISQRIDHAISATRRIIDDMRPAILDDLGLLAAIEWQAAEFSKNTGVECTVSCIEDEANLDKQCSIALFRILQEALTNVSRHSGASRVEIEFLHNENEVALTVRDNGSGIPGNHIPAQKSYGLLGMTERIGQLGGKILSGNRPDGGFCVEIFLPLPADSKGGKT
ncbi:MAG: PAS domain S-box protein [Gallionella sp.]